MIKRYRPLIGGVTAGLILLGFYWSVLVGFESYNYALQQWSRYKYWMIPLTIGFGAQVALVTYVVIHRGRMKTDIAKSGIASALSMIACCLHHLVDFIPILGFSAAASFLTQYQTQFLGLGLLMNIAGMLKMLQLIKSRHIYPEDSWIEILELFNIVTVRRGMVIIGCLLIIGSVMIMGTETTTNTMTYDSFDTEKKETSIHVVEATQSYESNDITYDFTLNKDVDEDYWVFEVAINTHSAQLDQIQLLEHLIFNGDITLDGREGIMEYRREGSGHHVSDYIFIPKIVEGKQTIKAKTTQISLDFHDPDRERTQELIWDIGSVVRRTIGLEMFA